MQLPHAKGRKAINRFVREAMSSGQCEVVDQALSVVRARHLIIDNPRLMVPDISIKVRIAAGRIVVQVPFPPQDGDGLSTFDPAETQHTINRFAEGEAIWAPVSNLVREQLRRLHPHLLLSENNAHPIVDSAAYRFSADLNDRKRFLIGRHSRPEPDKWPATRGQFLKVYPSTAPFDVSLLGIDTASLAAIIGEVPKNCRVLPYDSVPVADFLESIDFFVYYHHKSWIEAFGIATAEAMASGVPCILPPYMEVNFGDAAIYAAPNEARDVVARLHSNPRKYKERARFARNFVGQEFSGANIANFMDEIGVAASRSKSGRAPRPRKYDAVYVADFSSPKVFNHAFVDELTEAAARGEKVAACDMRGETLGRIHVASHAFDGHAIRLVEIDETIACKELVINDPWRLIANSVDLGRFHPERTTCLVSYPHGDVATMQRYFARHPQFQPATVAWAPRDAQSRMWLESFDPNLVLSPTNRAATVSADATARLSEFRRQRPITVRRTIGFAGVENEEDARWIEHIMPVIEGEPISILTCFGDRPASVPLDPRIVCSGYRGIDLVKWVAKLDRLVVLRDRMKADNLDYMIALCRAADIPVYYRWRNNKERTSGAPTLEGLDKTALKRLLVGESAPAIAATMKAARAKSIGQTANGHKINGHELKLNGHKLKGHMALNGNAHPVLSGATQKPRKGGGKETLLFVSQNGTGVGHVVRLLSIARRLADRYDCLFLTMSQAVPFISAFGFHAEYFPSAVYSGVSYTDWIHWLRLKIDLMIDAWNIRAIVFDGNVPYAAVAEAAAARPDVSSVWIRRGMWPDSEEDRKRLRAQTYFNMVIEPRDFAEELDVGPTRPLRDTVRLVPPDSLARRCGNHVALRGLRDAWAGRRRDERARAARLGQQSRHTKRHLADRTHDWQHAPGADLQSALANLRHAADSVAECA